MGCLSKEKPRNGACPTVLVCFGNRLVLVEGQLDLLRGKVPKVTSISSSKEIPNLHIQLRSHQTGYCTIRFRKNISQNRASWQIV